MVNSPTGSSDLILILGCGPPTFLYRSFSTLFLRSLWRTDTIVFGKNIFDINLPPGGLLSFFPLSHLCHLQNKHKVPGLGILSTCCWGERFGHPFPPPLHLSYNVVIITTVVVLTCINWIIVHVGVITGGKHQRKQQQCWSLWWKLDDAQSFVFCSLIVMALMRYVYYRAEKRLKF